MGGSRAINRVETLREKRHHFGGMSNQFENVSVIAKANVYFGGQVTSRTVLFADGTKKTLGFMQAGDYEFGTEAPELMEMLRWLSMDVRLDGEEAWTTYAEGRSFNVPGQSSFPQSLRVAQTTAAPISSRSTDDHRIETGRQHKGALFVTHLQWRLLACLGPACCVSGSRAQL